MPESALALRLDPTGSSGASVPLKWWLHVECEVGPCPGPASFASHRDFSNPLPSLLLEYIPGLR